jgi:non-lysosomal glucosylceramidase
MDASMMNTTLALKKMPFSGCKIVGCATDVSRRSFLKALGWGAAAIAGARPLTGQASDTAGWEKLVPVAKNQSPEWIQSLFTRGARTVYRGAELEKIGMPIGGICTGQVYLGGDGKLWLWDIFNQYVNTNCWGPHYPNPLKPSYPIEQGFAVRIHAANKFVIRTLDRAGFSDISFIGEYPIGFVQYQDAGLPISIALEAFSPFIPLAPHDSHLPATILQFTVTNRSKAAVTCELVGWLQNAVGIRSGTKGLGSRSNAITRGRDAVLLDCTATAAPGSRGPDGRSLPEQPDFGSQSLALLQPQEGDLASAAIPDGPVIEMLFSETSLASGASNTKAFPDRVTGALGRTLSLAPNQQAKVTFVVAWHFPKIQQSNVVDLKEPKLDDIQGRQYGKRFASARAVVDFVASHFDRLAQQTRLWHDTWYDSTLPYWFLDRTFLNISTLATSTAYWFGNGRFYAWEGVGSCGGTCTHVWSYAQAVARIFPSLERTTRETVDFGLAFHPKTGAIGNRAEFEVNAAVDGQAGTILRAYREHQMSPDGAFLRRHWPRIRKATEYLIGLDVDQDGILDGPQMNTADAPWFGKIAWLSSLYVAALRASEQMALEVGDETFARRARSIAEAGSNTIDVQLFNGDYYIQIPDADRRDTVGSYDGCHADQVLGQSWAFQVGLGRILPEEHTRSALRALWKYNFAPNVDAFRKVYQAGRWLAMPGEAGLIVCTWPKGDEVRVKKDADFYFNECWTGLEYQVAGHMLWEGMVKEGMALTRAVHDRYHASRRNPWNEIECGDHYARAMASYGVFLAACGYAYHGPKGHLAFAPRLSPDKFRAAFTTAAGWGTFRQERTDRVQRDTIELKWGKLRLRSLAFDLPEKVALMSVAVAVRGKSVKSSHVQKDKCVQIALSDELLLGENETVDVTLEFRAA